MIVVQHATERKSLPLPAFEMVHAGGSIVLSKNPIQFVLYMRSGGTFQIGGQQFTANVMVVQGASAPINISGEHVVIVVSP